MDPIVFVLLAAALIAIAFYLVALPLLQHARRTSAPALESSTEQERLTELLAQREAAFQALRELSFDHKVGKISDDDFVAFEANLKEHAAHTLRALDEWEAEADDELDLAMEAEIQARRAALAYGANGHGIEPAAPAAPCPACGKPASSSDKYCSGCGADLTAAQASIAATTEPALACPGCGTAFHPGDRFCGSCGQPLTAEPARQVG